MFGVLALLLVLVLNVSTGIATAYDDDGNKNNNILIDDDDNTNNNKNNADYTLVEFTDADTLVESSTADTNTVSPSEITADYIQSPLLQNNNILAAGDYAVLMILAPAIFVVANHSNNIKSAHSLRKPIVSAFVGAIFLTGGIVGPAGVHFVPTVYAEEGIDNSDGSMSYSDIPDVLNSNSTISPDTTATAIQYMAEMYGSISVLNEQSYPVVGGLWSTQFVTSGTHDLVITGINGTTFSGASPVSTVEINGSTVPSLDISIGDEFGSSLTNIGDLNGDGVPDLAVGARADDSNAGIDRGAVHILFMNTTGAVNSTVEINE